MKPECLTAHVKLTSSFTVARSLYAAITSSQSLARYSSDALTRSALTFGYSSSSRVTLLRCSRRRHCKLHGQSTTCSTSILASSLTLRFVSSGETSPALRLRSQNEESDLATTDEHRRTSYQYDTPRTSLRIRTCEEYASTSATRQSGRCLVRTHAGERDSGCDDPARASEPDRVQS